MRSQVIPGAGRAYESQERMPHLLISSAACSLVPRQRSCEQLLFKEALGEGRDEADLDDKANDGFNRGQPGVGIGQREVRRENAAAVEAANTEDKRLVPAQGSDIEGRGK